MRNAIAFASIVLFLGLAIVNSQTPAVPQSETCNEEFARFLVEQQVSGSKTVTDAHKRIKILLRSADFLWQYNEPTSRAFFAEAFKLAVDRFSEKGFESVKVGQLSTQLPDHRFEVVRAIASKDADWAKRLTEQLLTEYEKATADRKGLESTREISSLIQMATENAKTNPALSMYLYRRAMRYPLDSHWLFAPYLIAGDNPELASQLYLELLQHYRSSTPRRMLFLSAFPFGKGQIFGAAKFQYGISIPDDFVADPNLQIRFLETFFTRIAAYAANPEDLNRQSEEYHLAEPVYMVSALRDMESIILERFPNLLQRFSEAKSQANGLLSEEMRKSMGEKDKSNENIGQGFEARLKAVEEADETGKLEDHMIVNLVIADLKSDEQFEQIEKWLDKIQDEKGRHETTNYFWFRRSKLAVKDGRLSDAEKFAAKVPEIEHRAILAFDIAEVQLKNINDNATAAQTLTEVSKLASRTDDSVAKARVHLGLANQFERINRNFAIDELAEAVRVFNRIENPDISRTSVLRHIDVKKLGYFASFQMSGQDLESTFNKLSKTNFEMSLSNAKALEDKYLRTLAVIAIAKNCVKSPNTKSTAAKRSAAVD